VTRRATPEDIDEICMSLPEVEFGTTWGDVPTYKVPRGDKGRGFLLYRPPGRTAIDPDTGEMHDDLQAWAARAPKALVRKHLGHG
jgi:hypothetical protein